MADPSDTGPSVPGQAGVAPFEELRPFDPLNDGDTIDARQLADHAARQRRTTKQAWTDAINNSAAAKMVRNIGQRVDPEADILTQLGQSVVAITGQAGKWGDENWDKSAHFDELTKDLPVEYWEDLFDQESLEGAKITRANIIEEQRRLRRIGLDKGAAAVFGFAGSLVDVDLPLTVLTGGAFFSAKTSGKALYLSSRAGLSNSVSTRIAGTAGGLSAGLQAGALVGTADALNSDVTNWMDGVVMALSTAALGGTIGAVAPRTMMPMQEVKEDFVRRVREGDPAIWDDQRVMATDNVPSNLSTNVDEVELPKAAEPIEGEVIDPSVELPDLPAFVPPNAANDLGAAVVQGPSPSPFPALKDPIGNMSDRTKQVISAARNYVWSTGFDVKRKAAMDDWFTKVSDHPLFKLGTANSAALWRSSSTVLNRLSAAFFELPGGQVRGEVANAPQLRDMYERRIAQHTMGIDALRYKYAQQAGKPLVRFGGKGYGASRAASVEFYREVMLDMNNVAMGRPRNPNQLVRDAADMYGNAGKEGLGIMTGRPGEIAMDGADKIAPDTHFMPYRANGAKMAQLLRDGTATRDDLVKAYAEGYLRAGQIKSRDVADAVAKAYVDRFVGRAVKLDDSMISIFSKDGREFLEMALRSNKLTEKEIANIMKRFDNDLSERGQISTLKHRNDLDLDTPIGNTGLKLIDMMRSDLDSVYAGYAREVSGAAALARHGITSRASRKEWIEAAISEQRALGEEPLSSEVLEAMFSEYNGGPQWGVNPITGGTNQGIGIVSEAKSLTSLSTLTFNGFAQLAETGVGFITVGARNWYGRGIGRMVSNAIRNSNKDALDDLAYFMGRIGQDQHTLKAHLNLDESTEYFQGNSTGRAFLNRSREFISHANYLQGYTSLLNHIRGYQQEIGVLGMMDKISRIVREGGRDQFEIGGRIHRDTGLDPDHFDQIKALIDNGTIQFKTENTKVGPITYVDRLNLDQWDERLAQDFAAALNRSMNQVVQKAMIGETDRWMHTTWGSMLTHLQTFPILAVQKQFMRNAAARDGQAVALALSAYATSYAAIALRDALTGKDRDSGELARAAFGYSNITGWMPMYTDPLMSILGLPDLRVNQFGPYAKPLSVPAIDVMNKLIQAPGAVMRTISDTENYHDRAAVRAIPFVRLVESAVRMGSFGTLDLIEPPTEPKAAKAPTVVDPKEAARDQLFGPDALKADLEVSTE